MARKMTEWPSKRGPITKIMPSDGCIGDTVPLAVGKWYDFHEFGWHMGNVGEEFHLPVAFVERADGGGRKREVVGDEDQRLAGLGVLEADAPQKFGVILTGVEAVQGDGLVAK